MAVVWGPLVTSYYPEYTVGLAYGSFSIEGATPDPDTADTAVEGLSFSCRGQLVVYSDGVSYYGTYTGLYEDTGYCMGCDAMLGVDPSLGNLYIEPGCPVSTLPTSKWAFIYGDRHIWSDNTGYWAYQYRSKPSDLEWNGDPSSYYYGNFEYPRQLYPLTWTGYYLADEI